MSLPEKGVMLSSLRQAYSEKRLTLYLGAGISVGSGLPSWEKLVLAMYFSGIENENTPAQSKLRPFPNYLFAIAEWHLERRHEPLDITARKVRSYYGKGPDKNKRFIEDIRDTLYAGFKYPGDQFIQEPQMAALLQNNATLKAVINLFKQSDQHKGVLAAVSYNYDDLLEFALRNVSVPYQSVWSAQQEIQPGPISIYHVHGYIPMQRDKPTSEEIIFTEEQYYLAAQNAYSWSNLVQIQSISSSVGLMIGLSLTDRNMRRLLDAVKRTPIRSENYVLLKKPEWQKPAESDLQRIKTKASEYYKKFEGSGIKTEDRVFGQIEQIISQVENSDIEKEEAILGELGVYPIWYQNHEEIPALLTEIVKAP